MTEQYRTREERRKAANQKKKTKPKNHKSSFLKKAFLTCLTLGILGIIAGAITFFLFIQDAPPLNESLLKAPQSMKIYDMNGNKIADVGAQKRTYLTFNEIPDVVKNAVVATEDARFYKHHGIDFYRIGGAIVANLTHGFGAEGASTITEQVVKNTFLTPQKTLKRKAQEAWLAIQLERHYSKQKILEFYLNRILYGKDYYGVGKAAEVYFGLDKNHLKNITLDQAALLAGIPQLPNYYNPFVHPEAAQKRRNVVLDLMAQHGYITKAQAEKAKAVPIEDTILKKPKVLTGKYDAFIDEVMKEVTNAVGSKDVGKVLKVYTTLDPDAQKYVENQLASDQNLPNKYPDNPNFQVGITLLDTQTGEIRAIGGGRNRTEGGWNYATDIRKQPGSTIKPILDYGPAIEYLKWSTYHQIDDSAYTYSDGTPIKDWDGKYTGKRSMRYQLQWSRNIPALKALQAVGLQKARDFAVGLGIPLDNQIYEPYAIGGFRKGVSPLQMAGAYSAFGNNGVYNKPHAIRKIVFQDGTEKDMTPEPKMAMSDYTAFMITDMLKTVVQSGTGTQAYVPGLNIAGKTGTTNYDDKTVAKYGFNGTLVPDSWFVGYTPNYTCAVWTGFEKVDKNAELTTGEEKISKEVFRNIIEHVSEGKSYRNFKQPNDVVGVGVEIGTDPAMLPSDFTPKQNIDYEYFVKGTEPTEVSNKFNKLLSPTDFSAQFDQQKDQLTLTWKYPQDKLTKDQKDALSFDIQQSLNQGPFTPLTTTKDFKLVIDKPIHGGVYVFQITTVDSKSPDNHSDSVNVKVEIPADNSQGNGGGLIPGTGTDQNGNNGQGNPNNDGSNQTNPPDNSGGTDQNNVPPSGDGSQNNGIGGLGIGSGSGNN